MRHSHHLDMLRKGMEYVNGDMVAKRVKNIRRMVTRLVFFMHTNFFPRNVRHPVLAALSRHAKMLLGANETLNITWSSGATMHAYVSR